MPSASYGATVEGAGLSIQKSVTRTSDTAKGYEVTLAAAKTGALTTRTDDETGTLTMDEGHGITTGAIIDIYWAGGVRYGVLVGTVSSNSVPIGADDSGAGDVLPADETAITASVQTTISTQIDGDNVKILAICLETTSTSGKGHIDMLSSSPATIEAIDLVGNEPQVFDITGGATNVFTGDPIVSSKATNGDSTAAATLKIIAIQDSTP